MIIVMMMIIMIITIISITITSIQNSEFRTLRIEKSKTKQPRKNFKTLKNQITIPEFLENASRFLAKSVRFL